MGIAASTSGLGKRINVVEESQNRLNLSEQEKALIRVSWAVFKARKPDLFHKTWILAIRKSIRMNEIIALGQYCARDLTKWPKLHTLSENLKAFFASLIVESELKEEKVRGLCLRLGQDHYAHTEFGLQPVHFDIWVQAFLQILDSVHLETDKAATMEAWTRFSKFVSQTILVGYTEKRAQSKMEGKNRI